MKIFYSFIISFISILGYSQTILYQPETTSRTVQDPQSITLAPGFHAKASASNTFIAKIGPSTENPTGGPVDSNAGANNPSGTTVSSGQSFHDTKGNIEVGGAGQLQFTLPIALPPGVKSVAPVVNLVYTSSSGNGIAGYGWTLSGISSISRVGKTVEKDGEAKGIQLDESDYYSFGGQRLIVKSGEYGKNGAEYVTEKYSNVKIKSFGSITGQAWKGPEYWEVTFEDGSQAWYGTTTPGSNNATNRLHFNIVKWKDTRGNSINYHYEQERNVSVIKSITWGGNESVGTTSCNEIIFNYTDRNLYESAYINGPGTEFTQTKLLKDIQVKTNGNQFKKYVIEYIIDTTGYQYIKNITEYNSKDEAANPVVFDYPAQHPTVVNNWNMNNQTLFDKVKFTGDFNGDAYLDFVMTDGTIKLGAFNDDFTIVQTNKIFNSNAIVVNTLVNETGEVFNGNGITQYQNGKIEAYVFRNTTFVKVFEKEIYDESECRGFNRKHQCSVEAILHEGDLEGDGISNIIVSLNRTDCYLEPVIGPNGELGLPEGGATCYEAPAGDFIIDLKNPTLTISTYLADAGINENSYPNQQYFDIDGDGKTDIINISDTAYTVFEFVKTAPNKYTKKLKFTANLDETKGAGFPVLFGDFNGDGKLDFTLPITEGKIGKDDWKFYLGTGKGFNSVYKPDFLMYKNESTKSNGAWLRFSRTMYSISDLNADGKSDIVQVHSYSNQLNSASRNVGVVVNTMISKGSMSTGGPLNFELQNIIAPLAPGTFTIYTPGDDLSIYQPLTNVIRSNNNYYNVFLFRKEHILKIKAPTGVDELKRIQSITQGGVTTSVKYSELIPDNTSNSNFYKKTKTELYPYYSLHRMSKGYAVSQLVQEDRKQDFRYRGMTGHLEGKGMLGFHQNARSSWYADGFENTKIWSGVEIDPLNEGLPIKEWTIRTNEENKIFPEDLSENNTGLLSFKSITYQTDKLLNGQIINSVADADKPKIITAIVPKTTKAKDFLTGTVTTNTITYGDYYLPKQSISNVNNGYGITTSTFEYLHNPAGTGSNYYIGRQKSKTDAAQAYGDTKSSKEEYIYENNLIKTLKTWNRDNSGYLQETYTYDGFGNIIQKAISNSVDSQTQTTKTEYEAKGRFVVKKTDNLGLQTNITYNDWGQILTQTDPLGNTLTNTYDNWGKLLTSKTNLEGTTTYQYERDGNSNIIVTENGPDGDISKKYTNKLGQEYKTSTKAFGQGQFVAKEAGYDILGRKLKESEPYFEGQSASQWNTILYDDSVFPAKVTGTAFNGKKVETSLSGLTTTEKELNGYGRTTSKTNDALGNVVSSTDKGGTIAFSYNAAGEQIQVKYAENIVTTKYDAWGRKSEFNDPSNGIYKYEYDGFGQLKKIVSPKGTKEYIYNNLGQLITQKEISTTDGAQATDKTISFVYDNKGRLTSKSGTSKGQAYSSNVVYDPQGRLLSSSESSNGKNFIQKGITYDDKGRVTTYEKQLYSSGILTKINIENVYGPWSGELTGVKDKLTGKVLWELKETNAKGQVLKAKLGAAEISNTYDTGGFLTNVNHSSTLKPSILQLSYSFDAIKNELKSRTTGGDFNIVESFDYDDNNRLINWTNPVTGIKPATSRNVYDSKGRITQNDQVGTIKFENSAKIYQPTGMTLNAAGTQNYNNDLIQSIAYNENNDPVFIDGEKGDVAFQYGLTSMRQRVSYGGNFSTDGEGKFTKYYSEDGSFEVIKDNITGKEKHILYIGGTPYESNIVYLKNYTESSGSYKFLHKDYLGSILAISDEAGNKLEQRHFDAWGNFTHLQVGNEAVITDQSLITNHQLLIDRGYTSHEHFAEVGIIHMNGRLYDPLLRRFLNADENIQDPTNTQNYNKYAYVMNNPLLYNDPNGEFVFAAFVALLSKAVFSAVVIRAATYTVSALVDKNFSVNGFFRSVSQAAAWSIPSFIATFGIGELFQLSSVASALGSTGTMLARAGLHAVSMGTLSAFNGGNFVNNALSAVFASIAGDSLNGAGGFFGSDGGQLLTGVTAGGVGSVLGGGNFWQGAMNGFFITAFNHLEHRMDDSPYNGYDKNGRKINNNGGNTTDYMYDEQGKVIGSTSVKITRSQGGELNSTFEGYGFRHYNFGTGGALYDPSWDVVSLATSIGEIGAGYSLIKMGVTSVPKLTTTGFRMMKVGNASNTALKSSVFFTKHLKNLGLNFSLKGNRGWWTIQSPFTGKNATTLGTFLGRNSPVIGGGLMYDGGRRIYNTRK
ncbi:RHS repeat-associated core domain-containing protein [Chryseobacterium fistulae]|uniref:Deoxyribonuclease RhsC n=1 Tax=Chryseobacterium fistulae TaxID=2675058 RepID=A0A6N4XP49_9FLAO|nr:RHS repeat-associated core domain-containing protein [Chryseobacterium fistulae]CAA7386973.1 Putative deoxyribonuclease RhsC [Chryseobacterium fistulae]